MKLLIITGMSGAGKSQAINALEDLGYYCVDNVPPSLLVNFAELSGKNVGVFSKIALVVDVRSRAMFADLRQCLEGLSKLEYKYKTMFLDCADKTLMNRYKETRRMHPLISGSISSVDEAIKEERNLLGFAKGAADYIIDTTGVSRMQLRNIVIDMFSENDYESMMISCVSFGFKHGLPPDADLVFDVRCLPNPFYITELRDKTGQDKEVEDYVLSTGDAKNLIPKLLELLLYLIPLYKKEGKSRLVIAIGCTGGKHRSVVFAELIAKHLKENKHICSTYHKHILLSN